MSRKTLIPRTILLVEDDRDVALLTQKRLKKEGLQVDVASNGAQCLEKLNNSSYDAILLDFNLPDMTGINLMKEIHRKGIDTPQIIVTGAGDERVAVKAMKSGAYDYVVKTTDYLVALPMTINMSLEHHRLAKEKKSLENQLKDYIHLLEMKVEERTQQLLELNENLEKIVQEKTAELKEAQAQLVQAGKLAALGTLGAGVAHELNNPLTVVSAEADEMLYAVEVGYCDNNFVTISAKNIKSHAERMRVIIDHIRQFARDDKNSELKKLSVNEPIKDSLILLKTRLESAGIELDLHLTENLPKIWGHHNKLESIFQNLITNAKDAFASINDGRKKQISISAYLEGKNKIVVKVKDTASGIPKEVLPNIFDPFFTTKDVGNGTGLGLSITLGNVKEHAGEITAKSKEGKGTEFTLSFPLKP